MVWFVPVKNVLFLCTGNSARSILGEVILNELSEGAYVAHSAGSQPAGRVNPGALKKLAAEGHSVEGLTSKSWDQFSGPGAPEFDLVITVCDNAAGESCPVWLGNPVTAHWGIPDPARFASEQTRDAAFDLAYTQMRRRIEALLELAPDLEAESMRQSLRHIHEEVSAGEKQNA